MKLQFYATTEFVAKLCPVTIFKEEEKKKRIEQYNTKLKIKAY